MARHGTKQPCDIKKFQIRESHALVAMISEMGRYSYMVSFMEAKMDAEPLDWFQTQCYAKHMNMITIDI